ncbi:MAG: hypothetical protein J0M08_10240 [Bacteroidetes bacterium]|nr:hypothetical protein [Bacteroidota bacterium]
MNKSEIAIFIELLNNTLNEVVYQRVELEHKHLILAKEALLGNQSAVSLLVKNKKFELAAFVKAIKGDKNAFDWLMKNKFTELAATANAINKDKNALQWLNRNNLIHFVDLTNAIIQKLEEDSHSDLDFFYKGPIK